MIHFKCAYCGKVSHVGDEDAGRESDCPGCGERITVPPSALVSNTDIENED
jgi:DNA-directed RNA polymerase subunit RPC12/RpoP